MADSKTAQLVVRLHKNSRIGKILWQPTPDTETFAAAFPNYTLHISPVARRGTTDYVITILNDEGVAVDNFSDEDLTRQHPTEAPDGGWYLFMQDIYEMARRQALGADKAIDAILGELE